MPSPDYVAEKCWQAVDLLDSTTTPDRRARIGYAFEQLVYLRPDDFPDEDGRARWSAIKEMTRRHEVSGDEGDWLAPLARLSEGEIDGIEREIRAGLDAALLQMLEDAVVVTPDLAERVVANRNHVARRPKIPGREMLKRFLPTVDELLSVHPKLLNARA